MIRPYATLLVLALLLGAAAAQPLRFLHDNPEWQQNFEAVGEASVEALGWGIDPVQFDTDLYTSRIKIDLVGNRAPALFKWWFGFRANELTDVGLLADLSDVWDAVGDNYAAGVREALSADGMPYGFPLHVSYWPWYYSTAVYERYDLELPTTWEEMEEQLAFFASEGIHGIGNTIGQSRWTSFIIFQELLYRIDVAFYQDLMDGRVRWTDATALEAMEIWGRWLDAGYFAPMDATYVEDFPRMMAEGQLAFAPFGDWYGSVLQGAGLVSGEDYRMFFPPAITEAGSGATVLEISAITAGARSPDLDQAKEWLTWYSSTQEAADAMWDTFRFAPTLNVDREQLAADDPARAEELAMAAEFPVALIRFWEATPVEIVEQAVDEFNAFLSGQRTPMQVLEAIDATAARIWPDYGVDDY